MSEARHVNEPIPAQQPLATFLVVTYNQEAYIREAVASAFAQTYQPLEILLSDDCSTDGTFALMQELAQAYQGPHHVVLRQSDRNGGLLRHVAEAAGVAQGELLVLAAGDDRSHPQRTAVLVAAWQSSGAWGLASGFDRIDADGRLIERAGTIASHAARNHPLRRYFAGRHEIPMIHGATSAYDRRLFAYLELRSDDRILNEDLVLCFLLLLLNRRILLLDDVLVDYRQHPQSLTHRGRAGRITFAAVEHGEQVSERLAASRAQNCDLLLRLRQRFAAEDKSGPDVRELRDDLARYRIRAGWWQTPLRGKIRHLRSVRSAEDLKWCLPRMLPRPQYIVVKAWALTLMQRLKGR